MSLAENAAIYDLGQALTGASASRTRLARLFERMSISGRVLDLGGGTGSIQAYLPKGTQYICLDNEFPKLCRLRARFPGTAATLSDASCLPVRTGSIENVLTIAMPHHLEDRAWTLVLAEAQRVLRPCGYFFVVEPLKTTRWTGRVLWRLDRGSHPRARKDLLASIEKYFSIVYTDQYSILHDYFIAVSKNVKTPDAGLA